MTESVLVNFYIPRSLKNRLKEVCDYRHLSRTSFILTTLEPMIEQWEQKIQTIQNNRTRPQPRSHESGYDLPTFFSSNEVGHDF